MRSRWQEAKQVGDVEEAKKEPRTSDRKPFLLISVAVLGIAAILLLGQSEDTLAITAALANVNASDPSSLPPLDWGNTTHAGPHGRKTQGLQGIRGTVYLNHELKFGYVHLFKNGGSAILANLNALMCKRKGEGPDCGKQMKHVACHGSFKNCPDTKDYFIFTFSRNPWDRAVSMWSYGLKKLQKAQSSDEERRKVESSYCSFPEMLNMAYKYHLRSGGRGKRHNQGVVAPANSDCGGHWEEKQWKSQWSEHGSPLNFIGRLEHFERDWETVLRRIDASGALLRLYRASGFEMANDSGHKPYTSYYTPSLQALVARIWHSDVKELQYVFEHQAPRKLNVSRYKEGASADVLGLGVLDTGDEEA